MPLRFFFLLFLIAHAGVAVRIKRNANRMLSKASHVQHVSQKSVKEEIQKSVKEETSNRLNDQFVKVSCVAFVLFCMVFFCCWSAAIVFRPYFTNATIAGRDNRGPRKALAVEVDSATDNSEFEWCHADAVVISGAETSEIEMIAPSWNAESLKDVLRSHGLHITDTPRSRPIQYKWTEEQVLHFAKELSRGKARLAIEDNAKEDKALLRVVDMVIVLVVYEQDELVLQEFAHPEFKKVAEEDAYIRECSLKSRLSSNEDFLECVERCLQKLGSGIAKFLEIVPDILGMREETRILHSAHPGLPTLMQYYVVEAKVVTTDQRGLADLGLLSGRLHVGDYIYKWDHLDSVPHVRRHLKQAWGASRQGAAMWKGLTHSFVPVLPWTEKVVLEKLKERGFPGRSAPPSDAMKALLRSLNEGRVSLAVRKGSPPKLVCVTEKVSVVVKSPRQALILVSGLSKDGAAILPHVQRHASESNWRAAVRLCQTNLGLSAPLFGMEGRVLAVSDEVEDEKCWEQLTREHILCGPLIDSCSSKNTGAYFVRPFG